MNRRTFCALTASGLLAGAQSNGPRRIKTRASREIARSPLSVGFETLDRNMFSPERTYSHLAELGVKWARCQTGWARTERSKGVYDFRWLDEVVDSLLGVGIQPWFNLGYGNRLYTLQAPHETAVGWAPLNSEEAKRAWQAYVARLVMHFRDRVYHWEIWNEPNIAPFWQPHAPSPQGYMELVKLTAPVIRQHAPQATLIGGAFASIPAVLPYAEACFEQGLGELVDKISYHPYRARPELNYRSDVAALRALAQRYKPGMQLWQGENGAPSADKGFGALATLHWTETAQARWLLRRILSDLILRVELTSYFHIVDLVNYVAAGGLTGATNFKGLLRGSDYTRKPAYFAYQHVCALFDGDTQVQDFVVNVTNVSGGLDENAIWTGSFSRRARPLYVYWYPSNLQESWQDRQLRLSVWSGQRAPLEKPVLVDLLDGTIQPLSGGQRRNEFWHFEALPLKDYPLVVTDLTVVA